MRYAFCVYGDYRHMRNDTTDTIAAVATPPGRGGIGIVRISGPRVADIAIALLGHLPSPRSAEYLPFRDSTGTVIDEGIVIYFPGPHSFTGEDVLELQGHGGPVVMDLLLAASLRLGARQAQAGEFSQRAFLNDKLDLTQAEAIADLIDSVSVQAARSALRSLQGEFSRRIHGLVETLIELRTYIESAIDFSDEEIDFLAEGDVQTRIDDLRQGIVAVDESAQQGRLLRDGMTVALAGQPNAGKSSLLNALAGRESAIVTAIPGTTRDVLREYINLDGMPLHVIDMAGLRASEDPIEQEGVRRAWLEIEQADRVLLLVDGQSGPTDADRSIMQRLPPRLPVTVIYNKIDLYGRDAAIMEQADMTQVHLSAKTGAGLDILKDHLKMIMGYHEHGEGSFIARRRHLDAIARAAQHLDTGAAQYARNGAAELLAEELRLAQQALNEITGEFGSDDLLGRIFSSFCIGK